MSNNKRTNVNKQITLLIDQVKKFSITQQKKSQKKIKDPIPSQTTDIPSEIISINEEIPVEVTPQEENPKVVEEVKFPDEMEEFTDYEDNDNIDDILARYNHDSYDEYKSAIFYQGVSASCLKFVKSQSNLKLTEKQKKLLNILVNKIYEKLVIYTNHIVLNKTHPIYKNDKDDFKERIFKIKRTIDKLMNESFKMRKRFSYKKPEIVVFLNNTLTLYNLIIDMVAQYEVPEI